MSFTLSTGPELIHESQTLRESDDRNLGTLAPADRTVGRTAEDGDIYFPHDRFVDFWAKVDAALEEIK